MIYSEFIKNLDSRGMFRIRPELGQVRKVLQILGDPQDRVPSVHIAGTNGKGSVAAGIESVLRANGYATGLYTSPHLIDLRERIMIRGKPVIAGFMPAARRVLMAETKAGTSLTYFELLTAIAFEAFAMHQVDIALVECGLGGLWDATNVLKKPLVSVITSIGLDHTEWLGKTEAAIAKQKSGIIKTNGNLVSGVRGSGRKVVKAMARSKSARIWQIDRDFRAIPLTASWRSKQQVLSYLYKGDKAEIAPFGLLGAHQVDNAGLILTTLKILAKAGFVIAKDRRDRGLQTVRWPGRLQLLTDRNRATVLLDGAHNPPAMEKLLKEIDESTFRNERKTFVFSAFKDKDYSQMAAMISRVAGEVCLCAMDNPRSATLKDLRQAFSGVEGPIRQFGNASAALQGALNDTPASGLVIVTGSLFLVGQTLARFVDRPKETPIHA